MSKRKVVVVGSINIDTFLYVNEFPRPGETLKGINHSKAIGGKGANQAIAAARQGLSVQIISACGEDESGDKVIKALENEGIDCSKVKRCSLDTGSAFVTVNRNSDNFIVIFPGANSVISLVEKDSLFSPQDFLVTQLETPIDVVKEALQLANKKGCFSLLNVSPFQDLSKDFLSLPSLIVVNESEGCDLLGITNSIGHRRLVHSLRSNENQEVVLTLGDKGAVCIDRFGVISEHKGFKVPSIDSTGAGDSFLGALTSRIIAGDSLADAVLYGNAAGAIATTVYGAQSSIPSKDQIDQFLQDYTADQ